MGGALDSATSRRPLTEVARTGTEIGAPAALTRSKEPSNHRLQSCMASVVHVRRFRDFYHELL